MPAPVVDRGHPGFRGSHFNAFKWREGGNAHGPSLFIARAKRKLPRPVLRTEAGLEPGRLAGAARSSATYAAHRWNSV
jgi:hypothetical protein